MLSAVPPVQNNRKLTNWISRYTDYTEHTEAPREFHSWVAISTIAGALNRKCWIDMGMFRFYPGFYLILVAPPGIATKSTTSGIGMKLLKDSKSISFFEGSVTWQALLDELGDEARQEKIENKLQTMSTIQLFASELGVLFSKDDGKMIDMLVDIWDGQDNFTRKTRGGGKTDIARPYINFIGCTTPAWLSGYAEKYFIDGGFFSRTIFVYAEKKDRLIPYPEDNLDMQMREELAYDLKEIAKMRGEFELSGSAKDWGTEWYQNLYQNPPEHIKGEKFQSYVSRRQAHLHKVAMVMAASMSGALRITDEHLAMAENFLLMAEAHLSKIHESIVTSEKLLAYSLIVKLVNGHGPINRNELFGMMSMKVTYPEFLQGLQAALFARKITHETKSDNEIILHPNL